ncbi:DUF3987 domain-containing protein [Candidatus Zixiibacteriota bacterium]
MREYVEYASALTDAPEVFHLFVGLSILGTAVGKRAFVSFGATPIYPNLWIVLLAPTSFYRKSYSVTIGRNILDNFDEHMVMADEFSPEKLFESLAQKPQGVLIWSEFGSALSNFERSYMQGTKEFLADMYDSPRKRTRKLRGTEYVIRQPCISILSASTPEWLRNKIKEDDIRGGFFNRFVYVPATIKTKTMALPPKPDQILEKKLIRKLSEYKKLSGDVDLSAARQFYEGWYRDYEGQLLSLTDADLMSGFWTRLSIYTLKFAMLFQISQDGSLIIGSDAMSKAVLLTHFLRDSLNQILGESLVFSRDMRNKNRVLKLINHEPGISRSKLLQHSHLLRKQLDPILDTLIEEESIVHRKESQTRRYYPKDLAGFAQD